MLINFTVKNFKSFNGELLLNLSAAKRLSLDNTISATAYRLNILPVTGIYGSNGSGKSNLVNAIDFMRRKVTENLTSLPVPFKFDCQLRESEPSSFSVLLIDSKNIMYHYGFSVCGNEVMEEWLSAYYEGRRESILFERVRDNINEDKFEYKFGQKFVKSTINGKKSYLDFTTAGLKSTRLLITELAEKQGNTTAIDISDWFRRHLVIIKPGAVYSAIPFAFIVDKKFTDVVTKLLKDMDFDFEGFGTSSRHIDMNFIMAQAGGTAEYREKLKNELELSIDGLWNSPWNRYSMIQKTADGKFTEKTLLIKHKRKDNSIVFLSIDESSSGFRRMLDLVILLMDSKMM